MKNKIFKTVLAVAAIAPALTGCIEEVVPTNGIIQSQLEGNPRATEALVWAMPGHMNEILLFNNTGNGWDMGYPGIMHIRDLFTADLHHSQLGANYNHFWYWSENSIGLGQAYLYTQYPWNWMYTHILSCNKVIQAIDINTENPELRMQLGSGYAYRAFTYLDFGRMYETLPTDGYEVSPELCGLTLPIVDENTTEEMLKNNPRVKHDKMVEFIKSDLDKAVSLLETNASARPNKTIPDLSVVYGLYARLYLWDATYAEEIDGDAARARTQYAEAQKYAALAKSGYTPLTQEEWLSTTTGFNDDSQSAWMFSGKYVTEDDAVQSGNFSWVGWMATEKTYGYSSSRLKCFPEIGAAVYERISDRDWRKLSFVAPEGSALAGREPFIDNAFAEEFFTVPYISIKFRPASGNQTDRLVGCAGAYPLMRVEEMYLIEAEAAAHLDAAAGKTLLEDFMKTYRYSQYQCIASSVEDVVEEIIFQKRVELWGEGQSYFDIKRLNYSVTRAYEGSNFIWGSETFNTNGRPAWMNFVITRQELANNKGIPESLNAPTPAGRYKVIQSL